MTNNIKGQIVKEIVIAAINAGFPYSPDTRRNGEAFANEISALFNNLMNDITLTED